MSCIAGIVNLDGGPVEGELLERMLRVMKPRAPDGSNVWISGNVGLAHALLRISPGQADETQPATLDGEVWITADARVDGRADLIRSLRATGRDVCSGISDAGLILLSYSVFGDRFLQHLVGDFAFAIWDARHKTLICARDHIGVRPFFYVWAGRRFLFASDLDALLVCPGVPADIDEIAIADFLMFGCYLDPERTAYQPVSRLNAATVIRVGENGVSTEAYWQPDPGREIRYRKEGEYVDHFQALFRQAVEDRLEGAHVALDLSVGLDSTSIAAIAAEEAPGTGRRLTAWTVSCKQMLPDDEEAELAGLVAASLGIDIRVQSNADFELFDGLGDPRFRTAEPDAFPDWSMRLAKYEAMKDTGARVILTGQGGDEIFAGSGAYYVRLLRKRKFLRFVAEAFRHVRSHGSVEGMGLRSAFLGFRYWMPDYPHWIDQAWRSREKLDERWERGWRRFGGPNDGYLALTRPWLSQFLGRYEAMKFPVLVRHPFYDVRLASFALAIPNHVKYGKRLLRESMRDRLPEQIRMRPKVALVGDQLRARLAHFDGLGKPWAPAKGGQRRWVNEAAFQRALESYLCGESSAGSWSSWLLVMPAMLKFWSDGLSSSSDYQRDGNAI